LKSVEPKRRLLTRSREEREEIQGIEAVKINFVLQFFAPSRLRVRLLFQRYKQKDRTNLAWSFAF
jgi:hypothetical protein